MGVLLRLIYNKCVKLPNKKERPAKAPLFNLYHSSPISCRFQTRMEP